MRMFVAIELNEEVRAELSALQARLKASGADVKWVEPKNIHLTLKFLGEVDEKRLSDIKSSLFQAAKLHKSFNIHLSQIGAFPKISYARVVWVGIEEGAIECKGLQISIEDALEKAGFAREDREFSAHLTLGRGRSQKNKAQLISLLEKEKDFVSKYKVSVNKIILFQSTLTSQGPIYTAVAEFPLI
jgi:2'-5' RNA ligase